MSQPWFVALAILVSAMLIVLGAWGRRNAADLSVVPGMESDRVDGRRRVMHRGATTCVVVGVAFLIVMALLLLT